MNTLVLPAQAKTRSLQDQLARAERRRQFKGFALTLPLLLFLLLTFLVPGCRRCSWLG